MRIRTIKPEFFTHEALFDLEAECKLPVRLAFAGLWCAADRCGRFKWEPRRLGVAILPYDNLDFSRVLDALATRGFVVKYTADGVVFGCIPSFEKHQVINNREKASSIPKPPERQDPDASITREVRVEHAGKAEGNGRERNMEIPPISPKGDESGQIPTTAEGQRVHVLFRRRPKTEWDPKEIRAFRKLVKRGVMTIENLDLIEPYYAAERAKGDEGIHRRSLQVFLNNFNCEIDRARAFAETQANSRGRSRDANI